MSTERARRLALRIGCQLLEGEPLSRHLTLGIGGVVPFYARPADWKSAEALLLGLWEEGVPFRILGGGSNLLVAEGPLPFGAVQLTRLGGDVRWSGLAAEADADVPLPALAAESVRRGLSGLEGMGGIPGTVGGAVVMNAGAFGNDMARVLDAVALIERGRGLTWHPAADFTLEYRQTNISDKGVVAACRLAFAEGDAAELATRFGEAKARRNATQPWREATAGSVFRNPPGSFAGKILDGLGFRGKRRGNVGFSETHANFLVNHGGGRFEDAFGLCEEARAAAAGLGFLLEYEMEVWR
jgi:UDP-N-acetylmuramate dehydrogenase